MARIFYRLDGTIYGVHPGAHEDNPAIMLPTGVAWIDVPEAPHQIVWPSQEGEAGSKVNVTTGVLEALPSPAKVVIPKEDNDIDQFAKLLMSDPKVLKDTLVDLLKRVSQLEKKP